MSKDANKMKTIKTTTGYSRIHKLKAKPDAKLRATNVTINIENLTINK